MIEAFKLARKEVDCTLVLLGNFASDDPEGAQIYEELVKCRDERILILPHGDDTALVNTLQRRRRWSCRNRCAKDSASP